MIRRIRNAMILLLAILATLQSQVRPASVGGIIQSQDGTPASGIRVTAVPAGSADAFQAGALVSSALTDGAGRYRLEDIPPGRYFIAAGAIGMFTYLPGTTDESKATPISIAAGSRTDGLNFRLSPTSGVRVSGVVTELPPNLSTTTLRPYIVLSGPALTGSDGSKESALKADGTFEFRSVPPGAYTLQLLPGFQHRAVAAELRLTVGNANVDDITLRAPTMGTGRVVFEDGSPLPATPGLGLPGTTSVVIFIAPPDRAGYSNIPVTSDGRFAFTMSPEISYTIQAQQLPFGSYVKSIRSGSGDLRNTRFVADESNKLREVEVVLTKQRPATEPEGVAVRGRVIPASGQPLPSELDVELTTNPRLRGEAPGQYGHQIPVESDGTFTFVNVPAGTYTARFYLGSLPLLGLPAPTTVVVESTSLDLRFSMQAKVTIRGRVWIENGNAASALPLLTVRFTRSEGGYFAPRVETSSFDTTLIEGTYKVTIPNLPARYILRSIAYGPADASLSMAIDPSEPPHELVITLRDRELP